MAILSRSTILASALLVLVGCGPHVHVLAQATPSPFHGQRRFAIMPIDYTGLRVGDMAETDYVEGKRRDDGAKFDAWLADWQGDKKKLNDALLGQASETGRDEGLEIVPATGPDSAPFFVKLHVAQVEPGFYTYVVNAPAYASIEAQITTPSGQVLDRILVTPKANGFSVTQRLESVGAQGGKALAKYLQTRTE